MLHRAFRFLGPGDLARLPPEVAASAEGQEVAQPRAISGLVLPIHFPSTGHTPPEPLDWKQEPPSLHTLSCSGLSTRMEPNADLELNAHS